MTATLAWLPVAFNVSLRKFCRTGVSPTGLRLSSESCDRDYLFRFPLLRFRVRRTTALAKMAIHIS